MPMEQQESASLAHVRVTLLYTQNLYAGMLRSILFLLFGYTVYTIVKLSNNIIIEFESLSSHYSGVFALSYQEHIRGRSV